MNLAPTDWSSIAETDRLAALAAELRKLGAAVDEGPDSLRVTPPARAPGGYPRSYFSFRSSKGAE